MNKTFLTRRTAIGMIVAGVPTIYLSDCQAASPTTPSSGSSSSNDLVAATKSTRPQFHLTPESGWINDPERPLWIDNAWNLWVLWNADYPTGSGTAWRRYTSTDLINWTDQGVAIPKYTNAYGDCWTGSTVVDINNTARYGAGAIIALLTMACDNLGGQSTALWYSTNGGASFTFGSIVQVNPQAGNTRISDLVFRDPSVFWHVPTGRWIMSLAEIGKLSVYSSADLKTWTYESGMARSDLGTMECPNLIKLHLYEADGTMSENKWVLLCGANGYQTGFTTGTHYWVGSFDGVTFTPDVWAGQWLDGGPDMYATAVFPDANASDPEAYVFAIAWENNWDYAASVPTGGYYGQLSLTRQLRLQVVDGSPVLMNVPLAGQDIVFKSTVQGTDQTISDTVAYNWPSWSNKLSYRIDFTVNPVGGAWPGAINLLVRSGDSWYTQVALQPGSNNASLNRAMSGPPAASDSYWNGLFTVPCDFSAPVSVSVFVDVGSIEVFLNGSTAMSGLITAPLDATRLSLTASGGSAGISNLAVRASS